MKGTQARGRGPGRGILSGATGASMLLAACLWLLAGTVTHAIERQEMRLDEQNTPGLLLNSPDGEVVGHALELDLEVDISIGGVLAQVTVLQAFRNESPTWTEGIYVFPLPETAALDSLRMHIGDRVIRGIVRERGEARVAHETAKVQGHRSALVEQERPNLFTVSVANIAPGGTVRVELRYLQRLEQTDGRYQLRFPLAMTPRYIPGQPFAQEQLRYTGRGVSGNTRSVPDASRISPPVRLSGKGGTKRRVRLTASLDAGFPLDSIESRYHDTDLTRLGPGRYRIELAGGRVPADRDFELAWTPAAGDSPEVAVFAERIESSDFVMLTVMPPAVLSDRVLAPREVIFVIDVSGSMAGASVRQATAALDLALGRLRPGDRFNVLAFSDTYRSVFDRPVAATPGHLDKARRFVSGLEASGGTEMRAALEAAMRGESAEGYLKQIVFVTDGAVGNESELFGLIARDLGEARLFTVGIGSAPNTWFMRSAARFGRGSVTLIAAPGEVEQKMNGLLSRLESPVVTELDVNWPAGTLAAPERIPDVYAGEPLTVSARLPRPATDELVVSGRTGDARWTRVIRIGDAPAQPGIAKIWARSRIESLSDEGLRGADPDVTRTGIVELGLRHQLVTRYTSLVAVEGLPARDPSEPLRSKAVPQVLPAGQQVAAIFGTLPVAGTDATLHLVAGCAGAGAALLLLLGRRSRLFFGAGS